MKIENDQFEKMLSANNITKKAFAHYTKIPYPHLKDLTIIL